MVSTRKRISFHIAAFLLVLTPAAAAIGIKTLLPIFVLSTIAMITGSFTSFADLKSRFSFSRAPYVIFGLLAACLALDFAIVDFIRGNPNADDALQFALMLFLLLCWPVFNAKITDVSIWFIPAFILTFFIALLYVQLHMWTSIDLFSIFHSENKIEAKWVFNNAVVAVVLLSWVFVPPASAALKPALGLLVVLIAWALSFFTQSEAAIIGMAFGLTIYLVARFVTKRITLPVIIGAGLTLVFAPWIFSFISRMVLENVDFTLSFAASPKILGVTLPSSIAERAELWIALKDRVLEAPTVVHALVGHGADFLKQAHFPVEGGKFVVEKAGLIHPHNMFMQAWLDGGLLLIASLLCLILMLGSMLKRVGHHMTFAAVGLLSCTIFVALVSHSLFSDWWFANLALTGIIFKTFNENLGS